MTTGSAKWRRLAQHLRARQRELRLTQTEIPARGGPSAMVWRDLTTGSRSNYRDGTLDKVDDAMRWQPGSAAAVLAGGEPTPIFSPTIPAEFGNAVAGSDLTPEQAIQVLHEHVDRLAEILRRSG